VDKSSAEKGESEAEETPKSETKKRKNKSEVPTKEEVSVVVASATRRSSRRK